MSIITRILTRIWQRQSTSYILCLSCLQKKGENSIITTINQCEEDLTLTTPIIVLGHSFVFVGLCDGKFIFWFVRMLVLGEVID